MISSEFKLFHMQQVVIFNKHVFQVMAGASASAVKSRMLSWALASKEKEIKR